MSNSETIKSLAWDVYDIFTAFTSSHDRLMKEVGTPSSMLRNLFRRVDYESYFTTAGILFQNILLKKRDLKTFRASTNDMTNKEEAAFVALERFTTALASTLYEYVRFTGVQCDLAKGGVADLGAARQKFSLISNRYKDALDKCMGLRGELTESLKGI